ncbi:MAG: NYN domain-containing protein [Patescibacteria group bacterium]
MNKQNNFAYIDGNNLYRGVGGAGWKIDYCRFRKWLSDKYGVTRAYYFIGLIPKYKDLYTTLGDAGFTLVFKEIIYGHEGDPKGNCDADFVLQSVIDVYEEKCEKQIIITSDGDYACLVKFLVDKDKLQILLSPSTPDKCSILLKRIKAPITFLASVRTKVQLLKKKPSLRTEP